MTRAKTKSTVGRRATDIMALLVMGAMPGPANAKVEPSRPAFNERACDLPGLSAEIAPRLRCGTVSVPRDYGNPDRRAFNLAVVVIKSAEQPALPDPAVYISGGPGSPLTVYAPYQATHPLAPHRDIVLVDQRGIGRSEPAICPGVADGLADALAAAVIDPEAETKLRARFAACHKEADERGIDLDTFGTTVTAEDFDRVRQALGVERWNVFGVSYGTTVAMTLMARHPETIRSAVLDSVYPPDPILPLWSANVADARNTFFEACRKDEACGGMFPHLADLYRDTLKHLVEAPPSMPYPVEMHFSDDRGPLTASLFEFVIGHMVYYPTFYPSLPGLIAAVHGGDTTAFASVVASLLAAERDRSRGTNFAANAAVECRDRPRFRGPLPPGADVFDRKLRGICDGWSALGPPPVVPSATGVPTLVLAGEFDPNARPEASRHVADLIGGQTRWIEVMTIGHSVRAFSPCASGLVAAFIDDPARALDTSCAAHPMPLRVLPR